MNASSVDIKDKLVADSSLGLIFSNNLFIGREPSKPDDCVTIFDTYGFAPQLTMDDEAAYEYPSIQIRVCGKEYRTAWNLAHKIMTSLHGSHDETWNDTLYTVIYCSSGPALLDWDENGRVRIITNFNLQRR